MVGGTLVSLSMPPPAVSPGGANVRSVLMAAAMGSPTSSSNPQLPRLIHTEDPSVPVDPKHPELVKLRSEGGRMHRACLLGCGGQALLGLAAGGSMAVSLMAGGSVAPTAQLLALGVCTAVGLALGALSLGVYGRLFLGASRDLEAGVVVPPSLISGNMVRCMAWNVAGAAVCALGLQLAVSGGLMTVPFSPAATANALVALDHMAVQAASLMLLSHLSSLAYLNLVRDAATLCGLPAVFGSFSRVMHAGASIGTAVRVAMFGDGTGNIVLAARHCIEEGGACPHDLSTFGSALLFVAARADLDVAVFRGRRGPGLWLLQRRCCRAMALFLESTPVSTIGASAAVVTTGVTGC
eukprot:XP_001695590.1 predicted protein [Chlamydomonas reinhardtii]